MPLLSQLFTIAAILASAWLLAGLVAFAGDVALGRYRIDVPNNRVARRIRTQVLILRRLAIALIVIIAIGAMLLTFPAVRTVGRACSPRPASRRSSRAWPRSRCWPTSSPACSSSSATRCA
jgi:hypothetical protein